MEDMEVDGMESTAFTEMSERCAICETQKIQGIHVNHVYICNDCERKMIQTDTNDPEYRYFVQQLNKAFKTHICS
jgi:hypothetical protein